MAGSRITFHMPSEGAPDKILPLLRAMYRANISFETVKELMNFAKEHGLGDRSEMQVVAHAIQLLQKNKDGHIQLSPQGNAVVRLKETVQTDVVHFLLYTTWQKTNPQENSFLWSYKEIVNWCWDRNGIDVIESANLIAEETNNRTQEFFSNIPGYDFSEVSFSPKSVRGVRKWIEALIPPVIENNIFTRRTFCSPELVLLATGWVAQQTEGEIGIDFLITPPRREAICRLCLLESNSLDNVLDWMVPNYPQVLQPGTTAGVYGRYLRFEKWPEMVDLLPSEK